MTKKKKPGIFKVAYLISNEPGVALDDYWTGQQPVGSYAAFHYASLISKKS
jgi:hypothetical protein